MSSQDDNSLPNFTILPKLPVQKENYYITQHLERIKQLTQNKGLQIYQYNIDKLYYDNIIEQESKGIDRVILTKYNPKEYNKRVMVEQLITDITPLTTKEQMIYLLRYYKFCTQSFYGVICKSDYRQLKRFILAIYPKNKQEISLLYQLFKLILLQKPLEQEMFMQYKKIFTKRQFKQLQLLNPNITNYYDKIRYLRTQLEDTISKQYEYICAIKLNAIHYTDFVKQHNSPSKLIYPVDDTGIDLVDTKNKICYQCKWKWQTPIIPYGTLATFLATSLKFFPGYKLYVVSTEYYQLENVLNLYQVELIVVSDQMDD